MDFLRLAAALGVAATILLTGCGEFFTPVNNNPSGGGGTSHVYVTNAGGTLAEYSLSSGVLTALSGSPVSLPLAPTAIALAPNNAFLYVGTTTGIFIYTINSDGTLTEGHSDTVVYLNQNGYTVASMVVDPTSSWLIVAYQNQTDLDAIPIDPTTGTPSSAAITAHSSSATVAPKLIISPDNTFIYLALGTGGTEAIGFNHTSITAPFASTGQTIKVTTNFASTGVAVDPTSTYLYVTEADTRTTPVAGNLRMFKVGSPPTELTGSPYQTGIGPSAVLADKSGDYVYAANSADGTISGFSFDTTSQTLTSLGDPFPTEKSPAALIEDSSKTYVMAVGNGANPNLWLYSFDTTSLGSLDVGSTKSTASVNPSAANGIAVTF